jgi:circadian clock protein KaiB
MKRPTPPRERQAEGADRPRLLLRLYVAGTAPNSLQARANLDAILEGAPPHALEVIDVLTAPDRAKADQVVATPVLLKLAPPPLCRIVGTLGDAQRIRAALGI